MSAMKRKRILPGICIIALTIAVMGAIRPVCAATYFVSPTGSDSNSGSLSSPYATIGKAVKSATGGDTIYLRGGQHNYSSKVKLSTSGSAGNMITMAAYESEEVILDFTATSTGTRGIELTGSYWHMDNFIIQYAGDNGLYVSGTNNIVERIIARYNEDSGIQLHTGAAENLILNCDSYWNYDPGNHGENADGFATKFGLGTGNILRNCRSWANSDDGYDCWNTYPPSESVTFDHCWAINNGINRWEDSNFAGDGNGFKLGAGAGAHLLINCIAYNNPHHGIDVNGNTTGVHVYNCTSVDNGSTNYYFDEHNSAHVLRNNLSYLAGENIYAEIDDENNSWNGFSISSSDIASLDVTGIVGQRDEYGNLPRLSFLRPTAGSRMVNAGVDVGLEYIQTAPDLGAFEWLPGDCIIDGVVDMADLNCMATNWLADNCGDCSGADQNSSGNVDLTDFEEIADNWQEVSNH